MYIIMACVYVDIDAVHVYGMHVSDVHDYDMHVDSEACPGHA